LLNSHYQKAFINAMMNLCVCKLNNADGTATTGDVVIVPATQQQLTGTATSGDDVLPKHDQSGFGKTIPATLQDPVYKASAAGDKSFGMMAGTDEYLGTMTHISKGDVVKLEDLM
jgi:hypothetical protein